MVNEQFCICVDIDKYKKVKEDDILANICVNVNETYFPYIDHTDFVYPLLACWADEFIEKYSTDKIMTFCFMDSSDFFTGKCNLNNIHLNFYSEMSYVEPIIISRNIFLKQIMSAVSELLRNGMTSEYNDILTQVYEKMSYIQRII